VTKKSMEDLSAEQTETLLQFQDLTGIESLERCKTVLQTYDWNIELAVHDTFNEKEGRQQVFSHPGQFASQQQQVRELTRPVPLNIAHPNQRIYYANPYRNMSWLTWIRWIVTLPVKLTFGTVFELVLFVYRIFVPDPRNTLTDPYGDVRSFIDQFEKNFGYLHPHLERSTYSQVLQKAKEEYRFVIIFLFKDGDEHCLTFCRNCLCNPEVAEHMNSNALFWGCSVDKPEGYKVSNILRERMFPSLSVIGLRDNKMTVIGRLEGPHEAAELIERLNVIFAENERFLNAARRDADDRKVSRLIRSEQDDAFLQSLKADQEKAKKKADEEAELVRIEQQACDERREKAHKRKEMKLLKKTLRESFPEEPATSEAEAFPLAFKLPSGDRLNRIFRDTDRLLSVRNFIFAQKEAPKKFDIVKSFPRKALPNPDHCSDQDLNMSLEQFGLTRN
jgi:FAS-associated factor 2